MIGDWINSDHLYEDGLSDLHWKFIEARPFAHIVLDEFLREEKVLELASALRDESFLEKDADLFSFKQTNDLSGSENSVIKKFHGVLASTEFAEFMRQLTGVSVRPGAVNVSGTLYESTDYLLCHDDDVGERKLAYILYLGDDFAMKDGGNFCLLNEEAGRPKEIVKKIPAVFNSLMVFAVSKKSFHEVEEVLSDKKRYAIGGWLQ